MRTKLSVDLRPLRHSRDLRLLYGGRAVSSLGSATAAVCAALQVYDLSHSSLAVGAISVAGAGPMVAGMLVGGPLADGYDRRLLIAASQALAGLAAAGLACNALGSHSKLWLVFVLVALSGLVVGLGSPARSAAVPTLVGPELLSAAIALNSTVYQVSNLVGPAVAGLVIARFGFPVAYGADAISFFFCALMAARMRRLPPTQENERPGISSFLDGLAYVRRNSLVIGLLLVDVDAMVFGMPRALFPALGTSVFHGGATVVGLLYTAPAVGALLGAAAGGWIGRVRRSGPVLFGSVVVWGGAIAGFGLTSMLPLALVLLAVAGAGDFVSEVFRSTLLQLSVPNNLRGRVSAIWLAQANASPALGNLEAGAVANVTSPQFSVVSGGLACIAGALVLARLLPTLRSIRSGTLAVDPSSPPGQRSAAEPRPVSYDNPQLDGTDPRRRPRHAMNTK